MKTLFALSLLLFAGIGNAATCTVPAGATVAAMQSTLNSCGTGNAVQLPAGSWSGNITVPPGVTLLGPVAQWGTLPTAKITSALASTPAVSLGNGSGIIGVEVNGNRPSPDGGIGIYAPAGAKVQILFNYLHGNQASATSPNWYDALIYLDGWNGAAVNTGSIVEWNLIGAAGDCSNVMSSMSYAGWSGNGGYCEGIGIHTPASGLIVENNTIANQEQGIKVWEAMGQCVNCLIEYNDISNWKRFAIETQANQGNTTMTIAYNSIHTPFMPGYGTWGISSANGCPTGCVTLTNNNVVIDEVPAASGGNYVAPALEQWGAPGTQANGNLFQGYWTAGIDTSAVGPFVYNNNVFCMPVGGSTVMPGTGAAGYFEDETGNTPQVKPTGTGNTFQTTTCPQTSVAPTVSLSGTTFTLADTGANTSIWYTTDGSTPTPGQGTAKRYTAPIVVSATTTVKAVGMWGSANQPTSYAAGFGYVPSAVVSATYTLPFVVTAPPAPTVITLPAGKYTLVVPAGGITFTETP